jgi:hypothetical protein
VPNQWELLIDVFLRVACQYCRGYRWVVWTECRGNPESLQLHPEGLLRTKFAFSRRSGLEGDLLFRQSTYVLSSWLSCSLYVVVRARGCSNVFCQYSLQLVILRQIKEKTVVRRNVDIDFLRVPGRWRRMVFIETIDSPCCPQQSRQRFHRKLLGAEVAA